MTLEAHLLNSDAELNSYFRLDAIEYVPGENVDIVIQLFDGQRDIRFIPEDNDAEVTLKFQLKDDTILSKSASVVNALDRSMWKISLSQSETLDIISSNIEVELDFAGDDVKIAKAMMYNVISKNLLDGEC